MISLHRLCEACASNHEDLMDAGGRSVQLHLDLTSECLEQTTTAKLTARSCTLTASSSSPVGRMDLTEISSVLDMVECLEFLRTTASFDLEQWAKARHLKPSEKKSIFSPVKTSERYKRTHLLNFGVCDFTAYSPEQRSASFLIACAFLFFGS